MVKICQNHSLLLNELIDTIQGNNKRLRPQLKVHGLLSLVVGQRKCNPSFRSTLIVSPAGFMFLQAPIVSVAKMNKGAFEYFIVICICFKILNVTRI